MKNSWKNHGKVNEKSKKHHGKNRAKILEN